MADFPDGVYSPRTKENKPGVVYDEAKTKICFAEDITKLDDEVVAVETELGVNPKGIFASVKAWLQALMDAITNTCQLVIPGTGYYSGDVATGEYWNSPVSRFTNNTNGWWRVIVQVPKWANTIQSIKIYYGGSNAGNLRLQFQTAHWDTDTPGTAFTEDNTDPVSTYAGQSSGIGIITVPSEAYNGLSVDGGNLVALRINRNGAAAEDTYDDAWFVLAVEIIFSKT